MSPDTTEDRLLGGRIRLLQPRRGYRVAVDAVLLAASVEARAGQRVLDLGCGVGSVALCLAARVAGLEIVGLELQETFAALAERNVRLNGREGEIRIVRHDLAVPLPADLGTFDHVVSNPPYLAASVADPSPDKGKALATVESSAGLARWLQAATSVLKPDGTLTLVHRSDRRAEIADELDGLTWGRLTFKELPPAARVLVRARQGAPRHDDATPLALHPAGGGYTEAADAILRHAAPLAF